VRLARCIATGFGSSSEVRVSRCFSLLHNLHIVLLLSNGLVSADTLAEMDETPKPGPHTFHFSISSCLLRYCFTKSSNTFFNPSAFICKAGKTSLTVLSVKTPLIMRKHFRSPGSGVSVSSTSL